MVKRREVFWRVIGGLMVLSMLLVLSWWYTAVADSYRETDFSNFWLAGHMLANGQNPFSTRDWKLALLTTGTFPFNTRFHYPPWSAVMLMPLGILPFHAAITLFLVLTELSLVGVFWLGTRLVAWREHPRVSLYLFVLVSLFFRPDLITLIIGQTTLVWLFGSLLSLWLIGRGRDFLGGMLLASLLFKPQLAIFPILAVGFWACWTKRWAILHGLAGGIGILLLLSLPLLVTSWSGWVEEIVGEKFQDIQVCPTVWGLAHYLLASAGAQALSQWYYPLSLVGCLLMVSAVLAPLYRIHRQRLLTPTMTLLFDLSAGLFLSVTVIPYAHSYDQAVLLAPFLLGYALTQTETLARQRLARLLRWAFVGVMTVLPLLLFALSLFLQVDNWSLAEPVVLLLLLLGVCFLLPAGPALALANAAPGQAAHAMQGSMRIEEV